MTPMRSIDHGAGSTVLTPSWGVVVLTAAAAVAVPVLAMLLVDHPSLALGLAGGLLVRPAVAAVRRLQRALAGPVGDVLRARQVAGPPGRRQAHQE